MTGSPPARLDPAVRAALLSATNHEGRTALRLALQHGHYHCAELLVRRRAPQFPYQFYLEVYSFLYRNWFLI
jgi:hypothetical protein